MTKHIPHKTKRIAVKWANVDIKMIPIVNFFNSQPGIETLYCCQGKDGKKDHEPYILFAAHSQKHLQGLVLVLRKAKIFCDWLDRIKMNVISHNGALRIRYSIHLRNEADRDRWIKRIRKYERSK